MSVCFLKCFTVAGFIDLALKSLITVALKEKYIYEVYSTGKKL